MGRLTGKVAIITGAASGMGAQTARLFAQEGAKVIATDMSEDKLQEVVNEIKADGGEAIGVKHNVVSEDEWKNVIVQGLEAFGNIHVLVNNAGISTDATIEQFTMENWNKVMDVNLTGCVLGMTLVYPEMKKAGSGSIINISSIAGLVALNFTNGYTASKGALRALTKAAAVECAKDSVRVNSIHPGIIETPMTQMITAPEVRGIFQAQTPLPRLGKPEDIAYGALYLASDESSFVSGLEMVIDGGWCAR
ncbi:glucose 1-dehydrogenase [Brevibacillus borstelensis]|uniref:glucose 1-dehydrogenase n=1 Tax=Brevibacillus borstelensis TaxID=45462 RepID=UPI0014905AA5|nr:glucose 1-dehydrogenase [Brevibacillus borstelensis]NOU55603.1 glucose 1-dehydrogenase [Brevibacillus borstelensis]